MLIQLEYFLNTNGYCLYKSQNKLQVSGKKNKTRKKIKKMPIYARAARYEIILEKTIPNNVDILKQFIKRLKCYTGDF